LTVTDEHQLWIRFKEQGDQTARDELIVTYMRVVKYVAGRMAIHVPSSVELDDLIGGACWASWMRSRNSIISRKSSSPPMSPSGCEAR
jgi:hypothetical protein